MSKFVILGKRLRELRKEKGMTQQELADLICVTKVSICCYEKSTRYPSVDKIYDLANVFDTSIDYLLGREVTVENTTVKLSSNDIKLLEEVKKDDEFYKYISKNTDRKMKTIKLKMKKYLEADRINENFL